MGNSYDWYKKKRLDENYRKQSNSKNQEYGIRRKLVLSGGFCWICGELDVRIFEYHHPYSKDWQRDENTGDVKGHLHMTDFFISLCANCHRRYKSKYQLVHCSMILNRIEKGVMWSDAHE